MHKRTVVTLFCEDVRDEKAGTVSLIGVMSDNINVNTLGAEDRDGDGQVTLKPGSRTLPRLCVYTRVNFDPNDDLKSISMKITLPGGEDSFDSAVEPEIIEQSKSQAKEKRNLLAGLISRIELGGTPLAKSGVLLVEVAIDGDTYLAGAMNVNLIGETAQAPTSPTET
jgi:hypothetical protein